MAVGKNKRISKGKKGGKKKAADPFAKKDWYDIKAPSMFNERNIGKTLVTRTQGTKIASEGLKHRVFEVSLADLQKDEDQAYRKIRLRAEDVQGRNVLTNFGGMNFTTDKLRSLVRKWQTLIESHVDVKHSNLRLSFGNLSSDFLQSAPFTWLFSDNIQMQRERGGRNDLFGIGNPFDTFRRFGSFGSHSTMMPSFFGGRDPFDDPFFTRPAGSMFESSIFDQSTTSHETPGSNGGKGLIIEELNSDGEEDEGKDKGNTEYAESGKEPSIEHPDDVDNDGKIQSFNHRNEYDRVEGSKPQACRFSFQTSKVTYGGIDGAYYTSTKSRRTGSDGATIEERKEADKTTGQATHRISRGIHDKGHSVTRKLNSDGKVDTTQTLHNLKEDELAEFEEAWKGNSQGHLTGWSDGFSMHANAGSGTNEQKGMAVRDSWRLPYRQQGRNSENQGANTEARTISGGQTKKIVRINIE